MQRDPKDGVQYHVRYRIKTHDVGGPYWSSVIDNRDEARAHAAWLTAQDQVHSVQVFVREVSPWREDDGL